MGKNERKGNSPKEMNRCPVCGKFASKEVIDACKGMMSEVEKTQKGEIEALQKTLWKRTKECMELREIKKAYDAMIDEHNALHDEVNKLRVENERLRDRGFFDYLFGRS